MSKETHTCEAVVVHCIDFRFREHLNKYLGEKFPKGYDLVALAGGVKTLDEYDLEKDNEGNIELQQILLSNKLHHPRVAVLIQHEDCGGYGGSSALSGFEEELEFQKSELNKAEKIINKKVSSLEVEKYFIRISGELIKI